MNPGDQIKMTLTLEVGKNPLPPGFHLGTTAAFMVAKTPFKLVKAEVEIPGGKTPPGRHDK